MATCRHWFGGWSDYCWDKTHLLSHARVDDGEATEDRRYDALPGVRMWVRFVPLLWIRPFDDATPAFFRYKPYQIADDFSHGGDAGCTFVPASLKRKKPASVW